MFKSIIKEIFILILLCVAIVLVLGIIFYDYSPTSKIVPNKVAYEIPTKVQEELNQTISNETTEIIVTYRVDESDLLLYQQAGSYDKGKINPFANLEDNSNTTNTTNTNTVGNTNIVSGNNSTIGNFFEKPGTK